MQIMIIVGGPASNGIDEGLAKLTGARQFKVEHKIFPDGESYIRIPENVRGDDVVVVQSTYYPQDKHLIELLLIVETVNDLQANSVTAVVPYLAYARQDRRFREGEALSVKTILRALSNAGADALIVVEPHHMDALSYFEGEVRVADPMPEIAKLFRGEKDLFVLAPDKGAYNRAQRLATELGVEFDYIEKARNRISGEISLVSGPSKDLKDKKVLLVDDIASTGSTLAQAAKVAYERGAKEVSAVVVHGVFASDDAFEKLKSAGIKRVVTTNTIPPKFQGLEVVDVSASIQRKL